MATTKRNTDDAGQEQAQDTIETAEEKGYLGTVPDQPANQEYSIQSGPESPGALEQTISAQNAKVEQMRASTAKGA